MNKTYQKIKIPFLFFVEALKDYKTQGSLFPSSKYLCKKMVERVEMKDNIVIVELGAGTGIFTKELFKNLPKTGKLLVFEINHKFAELLRKEFKDERVCVVEDDANKISKYLNELGLHKADYIISGLPFGDFNYKTRQSLLLAINDNLKQNGSYMQFQYLLASVLHIRRIFNLRIVAYELRNIPPAFVYECKKKD